MRKNGEIPREQLVGAFFAIHPKILVNLKLPSYQEQGITSILTALQANMACFFVCLAMMRQKDSKERCVEHSVLIFGLAIMCLERS